MYRNKIFFNIILKIINFFDSRVIVVVIVIAVVVFWVEVVNLHVVNSLFSLFMKHNLHVENSLFIHKTYICKDTVETYYHLKVCSDLIPKLKAEVNANDMSLTVFGHFCFVFIRLSPILIQKQDEKLMYVAI